MQAETIGSRTHAATPSASRSETLIGVALAALFGAFLVWGVGFWEISAVHNAAHDTRHSLVFPCH
jgi:cobalt transporter subunit CbtB